MKNLWTGLSLAAAIVFTVHPALCLDLTVAGNCSQNVGVSDLVAGAGSDLKDSFNCGHNQITAAVSNAEDTTDTWRVEVYRLGDWPPNATLLVRRSSAGRGPGSISGGTSYRNITTVPTDLFWGSGDRSDVGLQLRIDGLSVADSAGIWAISVVYRVVDE